MLTYRLVLPSFIYFKVLGLIGAVGLRVALFSGKLKFTNSLWFRVASKTYCALTVLKILHLSFTLLGLSSGLEQNSKFVQDAVLVAGCICIATVALVWSREFNRNICDVIILLRTLQADEVLDDGSSSESMDEDVSSDRRFWRTTLKQLVQAYIDALSYLRGTYNDLVSLLPAFSIHDMLTIFVPLAVVMFAPVTIYCVVVGEPKAVFTASILNPSWKITRTVVTAFDLMVCSWVAIILHLGFFLLCSVLAVYMRELKDLEERVRYSEKRAISSSSKDHSWKEIRRLSIVFNIFNSAGSNCFYSGKIMAFTCSVLSSFYVLRFGLPDPISYSIALLGGLAIMFYLLCLGNAYVITETMDDILLNFKLMAQYHVGFSKRELNQRIRSVRKLAITESEFKEISKATTPEFVEFYVNQVIALMLTSQSSI